MSNELTTPAPRILIENSEYWLSNVGDLAMMEVTIRRLRERWPQARIGVLTNTPHLLRAYFPQAVPVQPRGREPWPEAGVLARFVARTGPRCVGPFQIGWVTAKAWLPQKVAGLRRKLRKLVALSGLRTRPERVEPAASRLRPAAEPMSERPNTLAAARTSSIVLALGGGYLTDADQVQSHRVLELLETARSLGIPTAMLGQGLGPIDDPDLVSRTSMVLPGVDYIGLREGRRGPDLLARAGVPLAGFEVTGDDAIELSYAERREALGTDIGVCLRVAGYSPVSRQVRRSLPTALHVIGRELGAGLLPLFIAEYRSQDRRSTLPLINGYEAARPPLHRFARPGQVAAQVGACRVVLTGAYHAAVFSLAQGIPVVALSSSQYYDDKFLGLSDMFGEGLQLLRLDDGDLNMKVPTAIRAAWDLAPQARARLLTRAEEQIAESKRGLERVLDLVDAPPTVRS
jgi:polysaccharide pyruvyl transferase WcaK-like protein